MRRHALAVIVVAACHGEASRPTIRLRPACADHEYFTAGACTPRGDAAAKLAASREALEIPEVDVATVALTQAEQAGPLAHEDNITLWKLRGIAAAYIDDVARARAAFEMLIALDPLHILSYETSPKATRVFEAARNDAKQHAAPAIDLNWSAGQKVGAPVPVALTVVADPAKFLRKATLFLRARGEPSWRAADVTLGNVGAEQSLVLPPVVATRPVSLELYLRAYDDRGNEVLAWADPKQPREIPLRYDPPRPWWQTWWGITILGSVAVAGTGAIVYVATQEPPDRVSGSVGTVGAK